MAKRSRVNPRRTFLKEEKSKQGVLAKFFFIVVFSLILIVIGMIIGFTVCYSNTPQFVYKIGSKMYYYSTMDDGNNCVQSTQGFTCLKQLQNVECGCVRK